MFSGVFKLSCGIIAATVALQGEVSALKLALKWAATVEVPPLEIPSSTSTTTVESEPGLLSPRSWEILEIYNKNVKIHDEVTEALVELEKLVSRKWSEVGFNRDLSSNSIGEFSEIREKIKELYASKLWPYNEGLHPEVRVFLSQLKGPVAVMAQTAWLKGFVDSADEYVTAVRELQEKLWDIDERYNLGEEDADGDEQRIDTLGCLINVINEEVTESERMIGELQNEVKDELHPASVDGPEVDEEKTGVVVLDEEETGGDSPSNKRGRSRSRSPSPVKKRKGGARSRSPSPSSEGSRSSSPSSSGGRSRKSSRSSSPSSRDTSPLHERLNKHWTAAALARVGYKPDRASGVRGV